MNFYVNDDGDVWIERGAAPWAQIQSEARYALNEVSEPDFPMRYLGLEASVRVSDEHEGPHGDDDGCADSQGTDLEASGFAPCCRTIAAHHFRAEEP